MKLRNVQSILAIALSLQLGALSVGVGMAASPVIGTAMTQGSFRVDQTTVRGNATLFEGSMLETATVASAVELANGTRLELGIESRGRLYGDHLVLEKGRGRLAGTGAYRMEALGLRVQPVGAGASGQIAVEQDRVLVAALTGAFQVSNSSGQIVANLPAGAALSFEPQAGAPDATRVTGCLQEQAGHYLLTDEVTNIMVELAGAGLQQEMGNRVEITGSMDPSASPYEEASQYIRVSQVRQIEEGCGNGAAIAAAAGTAGAAGAAAGIGMTATTVAIVGGVAAAAAVGGLAAADLLPGQGGEEPISRQ